MDILQPAFIRYRAFPPDGVNVQPFDIENRIQEYLKRTLTDDSDFLAAITGIITAFERQFDAALYSLAGLPFFCSQKDDLHGLVVALLW